MPFRRLALTRLFTYLALIVVALIGVNATVRDPDDDPDQSWLDRTRNYVGGECPPGVFWLKCESGTRDFGIAVFLAAFFIPVFQIRRLHSAREMWGLLSGRYHRPEEEVRVFLFADLTGSTTLAEELGHQRYSSLLQDLFADVSEAILAWRGQVYQYVGDGVFVTWPWAEGVKKERCIRCFFDMVRQLEMHEKDYLDRYGVVPRLRGAIHGGRVVTTWVGEAKRELAFHGEVLNATSRIQSLCRELDADLLVSEQVFQEHDLPGDLTTASRRDVTLRGRRQLATLLQVEPKVGRTPPLKPER